MKEMDLFQCSQIVATAGAFLRTKYPKGSDEFNYGETLNCAEAMLRHLFEEDIEARETLRSKLLADIEGKEKREPLIVYEENGRKEPCPWCSGMSPIRYGKPQIGHCFHCKRDFPVSRFLPGDISYMSPAELVGADLALFKQTNGRQGKDWEAQK